MKIVIVIYNEVDVLTKHKHILEQIEDNYWCVDRCSEIEALIKKYPDDDFRGIIMPDAQENPEFPDIIKTIYKHKKDLYFRNLAAASNPIEFRKKMKDELGLDFPL